MTRSGRNVITIPEKKSPKIFEKNNIISYNKFIT